MLDFFLGKSFDDITRNERFSIFVRLAIATPIAGYLFGPFEYSIWGLMVKFAFFLGVLQ